ncbi:MAG: hypothetical protein ACE5PO_02155 [Candidatus Bathyarchaeia archaeon]
MARNRYVNGKLRPRRLRRDRRGLNLVVSTAIMLSVVASLGTGAVVFSTSNFDLLRSGLSDFYSTRAAMLKENIVVEDVWFESSAPKYVNVTARNTGDINVTLSSIYVNGTLRWSGQVPLAVGEATTTKMTYNWTAGVHFFTVATERGTVARETWAAS